MQQLLNLKTLIFCSILYSVMEINYILELSGRAFQDLEIASTNSFSWRRKILDKQFQ